MHAESDDRTRFLHIGSATTTRWELRVSPQIPFTGFTCLLKGMGREQVETALNQACVVKNEQNRVGGFSPCQWVLGKGPREAPSIVSEEQWAQLEAIEAKYGPTSIFALQHQARMEAQKAFVHLDCSRRVQKALLRNASTIKRTYSVGDSVVLRRDNQRGGAQWSPPAR